MNGIDMKRGMDEREDHAHVDFIWRDAEDRAGLGEREGVGTGEC